MDKSMYRILEYRTEVKSEKGAGKLSVVSGIDEKGKLKTIEPIDANQAAFLKFNNKDGLLKNFMINFLRQFHSLNSSVSRKIGFFVRDINLI